MSRLNPWSKVSACAACLRALANTRRYGRYKDALESAIHDLDAAIATQDRSAARLAYIDFQNLCDHNDARDAEIHRAILDCLNLASEALWPRT